MKTLMRIRKKKLDNKGNTLGIIIVGIAMLGILGSLILNITYTNYQMKISDNQSKKTFYYVEKAIDEIYAGIGAEAMIAVKDAYQGILTSMVGIDEEAAGEGYTKYRIMPDEETQDAFRTSFYTAMRWKYMGPDAAKHTETMLKELRKYIVPAERNDNVETTIEPLSDTEITCDDTVLVMKNIKVSSITKDGYYSSITTDFVVRLPNINLGFSDTEVKNWDEFFKFAIVADGYQTLAKSEPNNSLGKDRTTATITVENNNAVTSVFGNIFAGSSSTSKKNSMNVVTGGLRIASQNFICVGPTAFVNSKASFVGLGREQGLINDVEWMPEQLHNYGLLEEHVSSVGLRLWSNSLVTNNPTDANGVDVQGSGVELNIEGDCIIADDLEINAYDSKVRIKGNYFGYGFQGQENAPQSEAGSTLKEELNNTESMDFEHEQRSAIIVNAANANVILEPSTYEDVAILGGRAYIDLVNGGGSATYMTGESVSVKGNQKVYKAALGTLGEAVRMNPTSIAQLVAYRDKDGKEVARSVEKSGFDELTFIPGQIDKIYDKKLAVPKRTGSMVYFYRKPSDAYEQTKYFIETMRGDYQSLNDVVAQVEKLGVVNLQVGTTLNPYSKVYSVGIMTEVEDKVVQSYQEPYGVGSDGKLMTRFYDLIEEMRCRFKCLSAKLETFPEFEEYGVLEPSSVAEPKDTTIYSYFISEPKIENFLQKRVDGRYFVENVFDNTSIPAVEIGKLCADTFGKSAEEIRPQILVIDNDGKAPCVIEDSINADVRSKFGIVLATGNVVVKQNFTGIIICGGNVTINNGATLTACAPLAKFLAKYDTALQVIFGNLAGNDDDENVVDMSALEYQNIVQFDNWRKNYSEIN